MCNRTFVTGGISVNSEILESVMPEKAAGNLKMPGYFFFEGFPAKANRSVPAAV